MSGKLVVAQTALKEKAPANSPETVAAVAAAVEEAAIAVYEATPAAAEFTVVAAALLAAPATDAKMSNQSANAYLEESAKVKAYQLDKK